MEVIKNANMGQLLLLTLEKASRLIKTISSNTRSNAPVMLVLDGAEMIISGLKDAASKMYFNFSGAVGPGEAFVVEYK